MLIYCIAFVTRREYRVTQQPSNFGLANQWFNAWQPTNNSEIAFIFEDDMIVRQILIFILFLSQIN